MWILLLGLTSGLVASSWASSDQVVKLRGCSFSGVFHIQGNERYTLDFEDARKLCEALGTTLATNEQIMDAYSLGFETCRYGWVSSGNVTIARHIPNDLCAKNMTGVVTLVPTESKFDAYCFNSSDKSPKNCQYEIKYVGSVSALHDTSEYNESVDLSETEIPTEPNVVVPVESHTNSATIAVTDLTTTVEKTNPTPNSSHDEHDTPSTEAPTMTTEDDIVVETTEEHTTILSSLDSTGSGMGETTYTTTNEPDTEDPNGIIEKHATDLDYTAEIPTVSSSEDDPATSDDSVTPRGRMGPGMASPPEEKSSSGSNTDWLVILIVVVAIAAIILVAALVVTRNRWCGRSQSLMITSKSSSEGNGTAASAASPQAEEREQEMVTLMNKEKIQENGNTEEFTVITLEESPEKNQQA